MQTLRLNPTPGLPGKLSLCVFPCGPAAIFHSQHTLGSLSSTPGVPRVQAESEYESTAPLPGPFPNADDPKPFSAAQHVVAALPLLGIYSAITVWAYFAWYYKQPMNRRIVVNDSAKEGFGRTTYAGGADKTGHFYANYVFARVGAQSLIDGGWSRLPAVLVNVGLTLTFFTLIEVKDGYHVGYGFSIEDQLANIVGAGVAALLLLVPSLDKLFGVRMYYWPSKLFLDALFHRSNVDVAEDYTGETVMLVFRLGGIPALRRSPYFRFLRYIDLLVGYNARGFLPKPDPSVLREQELFFGFSLNLVEIFRDIYPNRRRFPWAAQRLADLSEYLQIMPLHKTVGAQWVTPQPN